MATDTKPTTKPGRKYLVMGPELQSMFKEAGHLTYVKGAGAQRKMTTGTIKGFAVVLFSREVWRNSKDGDSHTIEIRSRVNGKPVNRRRLLELCGEIETKP